MSVVGLARILGWSACAYANRHPLPLSPSWRWFSRSVAPLLRPATTSSPAPARSSRAASSIARRRGREGYDRACWREGSPAPRDPLARLAHKDPLAPRDFPDQSERLASQGPQGVPGDARAYAYVEPTLQRMRRTS